MACRDYQLSLSETHISFPANQHARAYFQTPQKCRKPQTSGMYPGNSPPPPSWYKCLTLVLLRRAGKHGCVVRNLVQTEKGQTPAEGAPGPIQVWSSPSFQSSKGQHTQRWERRRGWSGEVIPPAPPKAIIPLGLATPLGCGEGHKRRVTLRILWDRREKTDHTCLWGPGAPTRHLEATTRATSHHCE